MNHILFFFGLIICLGRPFSSFGQESLSFRDSLFDSLEEEIKINSSNQEYDKSISLIDSILNSDKLELLACDQKALLLHRKGFAFYALSDWSKALITFKDGAIAMWDSCKNHSLKQEADSYFAAAMSGQFLNDFTTSVPLLNRSLSLYESVQNYPTKKLGQKYRGAGRLFYEARDYDLSELFYLKSIEYLKQEDNSESDIAFVYVGLGGMNREIGKFEKAIDYFERSYKIHSDYELYAFDNLAGIYAQELVKYDKATFYIDKLIEKASLSKNYFFLLDAHNILGLVQDGQSNFKSSRESFHLALSYCDSLIQNNDHVRLRAMIHENLAESYLASHDYTASLSEIVKAIQLMVPIQSNTENLIIKDAIIRDRHELVSMIAFKADLVLNHSVENQEPKQLDQALLLYYKIDSLFHLDLSDISLNNSQLFATNSIIEYYERAIDKYLFYYKQSDNIKYFESAFYFSSQLKALILSNTLKSYQDLDEKDGKHLKNLRSRLSSNLVEYYNDDAKSDSLSSEIIQNQRDIYKFENNVQLKNNTIINAFSEHKLKSITGIQSKLDTDEFILEYFEGEHKLYCFLIGKDVVKQHQVDLTQVNNDLIKGFIESCQNIKFQTSEKNRKTGEKLYSLLVAPLLSMDLDYIPKILIIPDGMLHALPFEALVTSRGEYLVHKLNLTYAYSHKLYYDERTKSNSDKYIGFGPDYSSALNESLIDANILNPNKKLTALSLSVPEIKKSAVLFSDNSIYLNKEATKSVFTEIAEQANILHLSMHAVVDYTVPDNSCLLFSDFDKEFILKTPEVAALDLHSDLVILSSCQSAAGLTTKGEGVQGLSRAFILAGSSSVLSSLWNSSELSSSKILPSFLDNIRQGKTKSQSLRDSKLLYLSTARPSLKHPYYWANYILLSQDKSESYSAMNKFWPIVIMMIIGLFIVLKINKKG